MTSSLRAAFTLIELLVVVAIIAVLASLLLPAISMARSVALDVACQSHQRQLGMASLAYAGDWNDVLPGNDWGPNYPSKFHWPYTLGQYIGVNWLYRWWPEAGMQKTPNVKLYRCPADGGASSPYLNPKSWLVVGYPVTYGAHQWMSNPRSQWLYGATGNKGHWGHWWETRLTKLADPTAFVMFLDLNTAVYHVSVNTDCMQPPNPPGGRGHLSFRHRGKANAVYADGHVGPVRRQTYQFWDGRNYTALGGK